MLEALRFVKGAVSRKDFQPELMHFRINDGRIKSFNGLIALSAPIDLDMTATPKAVKFMKAIEGCNTTTAIHMTPSGLLSIRSGKFTARVECFRANDEDEWDEAEAVSSILDHIEPEGAKIEFPVSILKAAKTLEAFISDDASRPWANGILLRDHSAYATNNIVFVEYWLGADVPEINIPAQAVRELLRVGEEPETVSVGENSVTFFFSGDRWLRAQRLSTSWPDLSPLLDRVGELAAFPDGIFDAVELLKPFVSVEGRIHFRPGVVSTNLEGGEGGTVEVAGVPERGAYHWEHLLSLRGVAEEIDFSFHPQPCPFRGERVRGVIQGMNDL